ncbi:MFS transporter [Tepidiforma sp.]|uniref:MFS transporter n=1 Tax=Tepidiforma sp. TaxID=2682230 RepID=UPI002ADD33AE|nr:MFS transporter [Tepidiforma sp.]
MTLTISRSQRTLVLALLCVASFAVVFNNLIITPILPEISEDFGVRVAVAGLLVTAYAIAGGVAAVFSGPFIDRLGRKPVVVAGMATLTVATALSALAPGFWALLGARALAGLGVACLTPAVFAAVGDYFSYEERGRAMSWVISANTSASIFGVPAGAVLSGVFSWRWTFVALAVVLVVFTWLLLTRLPKDAPRKLGEGGTGLAAIPRVLRDVPTTAALFSNYLSTSYWFVFATYMGAYFHDEFGLAKWALGGLTMTMGLGVLLGSNAGGRLADRVGKRPVILWTSLLCAVFIGLTTTAAVAMAASLGFLFLFAVAGGARFASSQAIMTEMSPGDRGTVMALNAAGQQFGIVTGSLVGGMALEAGGYGALGPTAAALALVSMAMYGRFVSERGARAGGLAEEPGV